MNEQFGTIGSVLSDDANRELDRFAATAPRGYGRMLAARTKDYAMHTDHFAHEHSWKLVGIAATLGLALGVMLSRR